MDITADLDQFLKDVPQKSPGARPPSRLNYSHDGFIDLILATPGITQDEIASKLGYSAAWVSTVMSTDTFKSALEKRRKEVIDPVLLASVQERFEGCARRALEIMEYKLSKHPDAVSENLAIRSFEVSARAAGFGARDIVPIVQPQEIHLHLDSMAENLKKLLHREREVIEHAPAPTPSKEVA
jgi:hypothetical protein